MPADYLLTESDNTLSIPEASVEQPVFFKEKVQPQIKVERPDTFDTDTYIEKKAESTETTHFKTELIIQDPSINTASNELSQQPVTETSFTEVPLNFIDPAPADTSEVISFEKAITQPATEEIFTQTNHVEIPNTSQEITATIIDTETTALESKITPQEEIPGPTIEPAQDILASPKHALRELLKPETPLNIQTIGPLSEKAPIPITKFTRQESKPAAIEQITVAKSEDSFHTEIIFESPVEKRSKETLEVTAEPQPITQEIITMDPAEVSQTALRERVVVKRDVKEQQPEPAREIFAPVIIERNKKILDADKKINAPKISEEEKNVVTETKIPTISHEVIEALKTIFAFSEDGKQSKSDTESFDRRKKTQEETTNPSLLYTKNLIKQASEILSSKKPAQGTMQNNNDDTGAVLKTSTQTNSSTLAA
jgi:hypothetical protein